MRLARSSSARRVALRFLPPRLRKYLDLAVSWPACSLPASETLIDVPPEWRRTASGFARRYGAREAAIVSSNGIEAVLGAAWGEDPRYFGCRCRGFAHRTGDAGRLGTLHRHRGEQHGSARMAFPVHGDMATDGLARNDRGHGPLRGKLMDRVLARHPCSSRTLKNGGQPRP